MKAIDATFTLTVVAAAAGAAIGHRVWTMLLGAAFGFVLAFFVFHGKGAQKNEWR